MSPDLEPREVAVLRALEELDGAGVLEAVAALARLEPEETAEILESLRRLGLVYIDPDQDLITVYRLDDDGYYYLRSLKNRR